MYYVWTNKVKRNLEYTEADFSDISVLTGLKVLSAKPLANVWPKNIELIVQTKHTPNDAFECGPLLIVNDRLKNILKFWESKIEYLPITVIHDGVKYGKYYFANILKTIDYLDKKSAVFDEYDGEVDSVEVLKLKNNEINEPIFYLDSFDKIILVNQKVVSDIQNQGIEGVKFVTPEEWIPY